MTLLTGLTCLATDYRTLLRDKSTGEAVAGATALLMAPDSTTIAVVVSDAEGAVRLSGEGASCLRISHLMYHPLTVDLVGETLPDTLRLEPRSELLEGLVVSAERPVMKLLEGGISSYDVELLFEKSPVSTAYEMLCRLPGMREEGGVPVLTGVSGFTLVMNGKPSSLPQDQLLEQLKSIPVSLVASAEISYTPIARYRAKGASVNIVLKHQSRERVSSGLSAQLFGTYTSSILQPVCRRGKCPIHLPERTLRRREVWCRSRRPDLRYVGGDRSHRILTGDKDAQCREELLHHPYPLP